MGTGADGTSFRVDGEYLEVDPPRLLVHTWIAKLDLESENRGALGARATRGAWPSTAVQKSLGRELWSGCVTKDLRALRNPRSTTARDGRACLRGCKDS